MLKRALIILSCVLPIKTALAEEVVGIATKDDMVSNITFIEEESAECSISDGKLILIQNSGVNHTYQVWIDRWFMNVQTPDHTKQILSPKSRSTPLGCSIVRSGGNQHWTIYSVEAISE